MLSTVDIPASVNASDSCVSATKQRSISNGVSVSRLKSGAFAIAVHDGDRRAIVELSAAELRDFAARLLRFAA